MSTAPVADPAGRPRPRGAAARLPQLVLLPSAHRRSRAPFVLVVLFLLGSGLIGLLLLNTVLAQDAFVLYRLQQQTAVLNDREQQLREQVARAEAPGVLASRAAALGMVPGGDPLFLRLPDGVVLGDPTAAQGVAPQPTARASIGPSMGPGPTPSVRPTASPSRAGDTPNRSPRPTLKRNFKVTPKVTPKTAAKVTPSPRPTGARP